MKKNLLFFSVLLLTSGFVIADEQPPVTSEDITAEQERTDLELFLEGMPGKIKRYETKRSTIDFEELKKEGFDAVCFPEDETIKKSALDKGYTVFSFYKHSLVVFDKSEKHDELMAFFG